MTELHTLDVAGQQGDANDVFPLVVDGSAVGCMDDVQSWVQARREQLAARLSTHGAVLFRGLPIASIDDFDAFIRCFDLPNFQYKDSLSNAVRVNKTERVFTANEAPPDVEIFMHHEMAQTPVYPSRLFFYCDKPSEVAGATPICRSDRLWQNIERDFPDFAERARAHGLHYTNVMPADDDAQSGQGRSWKSTFFADTRDAAEARMRELGYTWRWQEDGSLAATTPRLDAVRTLDDGSESFFNQLIAAFKGWKDTRNDPAKAITFGDGSPLPADTVLAICDMADAMAFDIPWQAGDVALIDNYRVMHGRRPFEGSRRVLASLVAA